MTTIYLFRAPQVLPLVSDSFNRADNASSLGSADTGQAWRASTGTWGISGNHAYLVSTTASAIATLDSGVTDGTLTADITLSATSNRAAVGLVFRLTDAGNFLLVNLRKTGTGASDSVTLYKCVATAYTSLATVSSFGFANGQTYATKIVLAGSKITVSINGASAITYTLVGGDATMFGPQTLVGMRIDATAAGDNGGSRLDNFKLVK